MQNTFISKILIWFGLLLFQCTVVGATIEDERNYTLLTAQHLQKADKYYQNHIKSQASPARTQLERLERKVNAKHAFDRQDWYSSRYTLQYVLSDNESDYQSWFLLIKAVLELQKQDTYQNYDDLLETALIKAYQKANSDLDKAAVIVLAQPHFKELKAPVQNKTDIEQHSQNIIMQYPSEFAPFALNIPQRTDVASACISWSKPLVKNKQFHYGNYITLNPSPKDFNIHTKGNQLCLEGLAFGQNYQVTFKKGFSGEHVKLQEPQKLDLYVPHRKPSISFREKGYILPSGAPQLIPLVAVNVQKVKLKIYQVPERNIPAIQTNWFANSIHRWEEYQLEEEQGQLIWQGTYHFPTEQDKTALSGVPIHEIIGKSLQPGVYVVIAALDNEHLEGAFASQALVISDIGLSTYQGPDGLHVYARKLSTASVMSDVQITLYARNNRELGKLTTAKSGNVRFSPQLLNGKGGNAPAYLSANIQGKEFTILNLRNEAFDLKDRGVKGRQSSTTDVFLTTERGIYRPGETVHHLALLRDSHGNAISQLPLTLKVFRPDGAMAHQVVLQDLGNGAYLFDYPIHQSAQTGLWTTTIGLEENKEITHIPFEVNDFVPPRIELKTSSDVKLMTQGQPNPISVNAQYYFGQPGAKLKVQAESTLTVMKVPFEKWKAYQFGLEEESWSVLRFKHQDNHTDANGQALVMVQVPYQPQTTHPLQLETSISVFEAGNRAKSIKHSTPFWHQPFLIGISPRFKDKVSQNEAIFDIIAVNQQGELQEKSALTYRLYEEQHDYVWFRAGVNWQYEVVIRDKVVANGQVTLNKANPTAFKIPVQYGTYRLEITDEQSGVASSLRFGGGFYHTNEAPDRPDVLEFALEANEPAKAKVHLKSPYKGELFIALAGETFKPVYSGKIDNVPTTLEIPLNQLENSSGNYLIATVFAPRDDKASKMPKRAIGVAWFSNEKVNKAHRLDIQLEHPEQIPSSDTVEIKVKTKKPTQSLRYVVALVDEGTLSLTDFKSPDPYQYFFSQKNLPFAIKDNYGLLINPYGVRPGSFEVGGGSSEAFSNALTQLSAKAFKVVSLTSGIISAKGETTSIPFKLPPYTGKLRVMALAWDEQGLGQAQSELIVQDPIDLYFALPRFLAPTDEATVPLIINNVKAASGEYTVILETQGSPQTHRIQLKQGQEIQLPITLRYTDNGIKKIKVTLKKDNKILLTRDWELSVRPKVQSTNLIEYGKIAPNQSLALSPSLLQDFEANSSRLTLSLGSMPELGSAQFIDELLQYPYHCLEQTTSRLVATLYSNQKDLSLDNIYNQLITLQKIDGSFALWTQSGHSEPWLSLYAQDVLSIAKQKGHPMPLPLNAGLQRWVKEIAQSAINRPEDISHVAYAHYLLAKEKQGNLPALQFFAENYLKEIVFPQDMAFVAAAFAHYQDPTRAAFWFDKAIQTQTSSDPSQFGSSIRNLAIVVSLLAQTTEQDPRLFSLTQSLVDKIRDAKYLNTQEMAWLIRASSAIKEKQKPYHLKLNQNTLTEVSSQFLKFSAPDLNTHPSLLNTGNTPVYYAMTKQGEPLDIKKLPQAGFEIKRTVYTLNGQTADLTQLKSGERYIVHLQGRRLLESLNHILIVDLLPAGFEIEQTLKESFDWLGPLTHANRLEGRDDRFFAALELAQQNDLSVAYIVRAVSAGTFIYPAPYVSAMYQSQYFLYGNEEKVTVLRHE
ncbi:MAG: alpha-2-macroglobulin family protein [Proteobacteria bacterium]|nr:alpha-2-macroglobulin family protein [Pseudomonadota bacterium]